MRDPYVDNQIPLPYQETPAQSNAPTQPVTAPQPVVPGPMQTPPGNPRRSGGLRTGAIIAMTVLLAVVFGVGLFAGWQFGRTGNTSAGALQPGTGGVATVPPLTDNNVQAVREAVIAKVRPAVVQVILPMTLQF